MNRINIKAAGLATALTSVIFYVGCALLIMLSGKDGAVFFFNSIFHGIDTTPIIRTSMPWWEMVFGIIGVFIIAWFFGVTVASFYNLTMSQRSNKESL